MHKDKHSCWWFYYKNVQPNSVGPTMTDRQNQIISPRLADRMNIVLHDDQNSSHKNIRSKSIRLKNILFILYRWIDNGGATNKL